MQTAQGNAGTAVVTVITLPPALAAAVKWLRDQLGITKRHHDNSRWNQQAFQQLSAQSRRSAWLWLYRRWPLRCADLVSLARGQSPVGGPGSGVVVFVPQLVSKAARRGDRLDGEAVFEAA
jgi:hypothetical protein